MYEEVFEGMNYTNHEIAQMFDKTFEQDLELSGKSDDMVLSLIHISNALKRSQQTVHPMMPPPLLEAAESR